MIFSCITLLNIKFVLQVEVIKVCLFQFSYADSGFLINILWSLMGASKCIAVIPLVFIERIRVDSVSAGTDLWITTFRQNLGKTWHSLFAYNKEKTIAITKNRGAAVWVSCVGMRKVTGTVCT